MTLTAIIPSLRTSIPDPIRSAIWPAHTVATITDTIVNGVSMVRLADVCGTPFVHTEDTAGAIMRVDGSLTRAATVVVVAVTDVMQHGDGDRLIIIDACLDHLDAVWNEIRLIGRASTARSTRVVVLADEPHGRDYEGRSVATLPADLTRGDLLVVPCSGALALRDLRSPAGDAPVPVAELVSA